ncbi:MAG: S-layer homology domain-containing protein [Oscillospiraceae bacterium]|nr:S-layer homology domain-containing protein [Oscillospiraceae bacterium]
MNRRICSLLLIFFLLTQLWIPTYAASSMTTSADGKAFIKEQQAGQSYDLSTAEKQVNTFIDKYSLSLKQHQFDALVDLVVAYPGSKILSSGYKIEKLIGGNSYTDTDLASAFTSWVKEGGNVSAEKLTRRIREAKLFLYGSYDGNCNANFRYVLFNPNGGELVSSNMVVCFPYGKMYSNLPVATKSGKHFAGWFTTASSGDHIHNSTVADSNRTIYAHWSDTAVSDPNVGQGSSGSINSDIPLKTSEACIQFLKETEGFSATKYWDNSQYTIGYGTKCEYNEYPNGISVEEADRLLRLEIASFEKTVDKLLKKATITHSQNQYDAIISFTFNLGSQWINSGYRIYQYILFGHPSETDFISAMGAWANSGGGLSDPHMRRRMDEANMYLNGSYVRFSTTYSCIHLYGNGGTISSNSKTEAAYYCRSGQAVGTLPTANREGYTFTGWYTAKSGGTVYTSDTVAPTLSTTTGAVTKLYAQWTPVQPEPPTEPPTEAPTDPTEPTEPPEPINPVDAFGDVSDKDWFYTYVAEAVEKGLLNGMSSTSFAPHETMTRAMVVTVLHRLAGSPAPAGSHPFTDIGTNDWYTNAVIWAYENGIVNGISDTLFGKDEPVSRQQLVTMLYRFAKLKNLDVSTQTTLEDFSDADSVAEYAKPPFCWSVSKGIINGSDGKLMPEGAATRAQCAKIIVVFSHLIA